MEKRPFPAYQGDEPYVFVSYSHADSQTVFRLLVALRNLGVNIWYDEGIAPGSKWRTELSNAIANAERMLFVVSATSVKSENCEREVDYALSLNVPVQVCYLEDVSLPPALSFSLGSHQAIVASHYDEEVYQRKVYDALTGHSERSLGQIVSKAKGVSPRTLAGFGLAAAAAAGGLFVAYEAVRPEQSETREVLNIRPTVDDPVRIAIEPLKNVSGDENLDWIGAGLANLLRSELSTSRYAVILSPVSWSSISKDAASDSERAAAARKQGVDYLVSGELLGDGENLLASVRVANLRVGVDVMSQTFSDLTTEQLVGSSESIATSIKRAIKIPRESDLMSLSADFYTENITAYEAYVKGLEQFNNFDYREAEESMRTALALAPDFHIARYRLAEILDSTSRIGLAAKVLSEIPDDAKLDRRERDYVDAFGSFLEGDFEKSIERYESLLRDFPYEVEAQILFAEVLFHAYQPMRAIEVLEALKRQEPDNPHAMAALGFHRMSVGLLQEAENALSEYVRRYPEEPNALELFGALKLRMRDIESAKENFLAALEVDPEFTPAQIGLAKALALSDQLEEAAAQFLEIRDNTELEPRGRIDAAFNLAYVLRALERPETVESALKPVHDLIIEESNRAGLYWYVLSQAKSDLGERETALEYLENGERDTPSPGAPTRFLHLRGVLKAQAGEPIAEETAALAKYRLGPDQPDKTEEKAILHLQGLEALNRGETKKAVALLKTATELQGYEYTIYEIDLARAIFERGKSKREAIRLLDKAESDLYDSFSAEIRLDLLLDQKRARKLKDELEKLI